MKSFFLIGEIHFQVIAGGAKMKRKWVESYAKFRNHQDEKLSKLAIRISNIERMIEYLAAKVFENEDA